jgi:hypothetical protein
MRKSSFKAKFKEINDKKISNLMNDSLNFEYTYTKIYYNHKFIIIIKFIIKLKFANII